jgi:predicted RNA-binding protein with RPS1 domain
VSNITGGRIQTPSEVVKRNDRVKVKVMSVAGTKVGLSMKDVDQRTGADLSYAETMIQLIVDLIFTSKPQKRPPTMKDEQPPEQPLAAMQLL